MNCLLFVFLGVTLSSIKVVFLHRTLCNFPMPLQRDEPGCSSFYNDRKEGSKGKLLKYMFTAVLS